MSPDTEPTPADLKEVLRELFHGAILAEVSERELRHHPLRVLQAVKSLMGLDLSLPHTALLDWTRAYVTSFPTFPAEELKIRIRLPKGNVAWDNLARAISANDPQRLEEELGILTGTASAEQLLEFLLEQALLQGPAVFLFVWSAMRMVRFLGSENTSKVLGISARRLLGKDGFIELTDPVLNFECLGAMGQLRQETFIRIHSILQNANGLEAQLVPLSLPKGYEPVSTRVSVEKLVQDFRQTPNEVDPVQVAGLSGTSSRLWIRDFISALPSEYFSPELLLCLDTGRALLKDLPPAEAAAVGFALGNNLKRIKHA